MFSIKIIAISLPYIMNFSSSISLPFLSTACQINPKRVVSFSDICDKSRVHKNLHVTEKEIGKIFCQNW